MLRRVSLLYQTREGVNEVNKSVRDDLRDVWAVLSHKVQERIGRPLYDAWLAPVTGELLEGRVIIINATSEFAVEWITERYKHHFIDVLRELTGQDFKVKVTYVQTKTERGGSDCSLIEGVVTNANDDCNKIKVKRVSVGVPIITPSTSSKKLRRDNEKITRSLNLPLAKSGPSNAEKRLYAENERICRGRKKPRRWW
nr:DnaA N-terminal domain-containing protein [Sporosarcina sp. 6E9]